MAGNGSLKQQIYQQIFEKIINNEFPLNEFLVEGRLAEMFGVSRAPVREALVELCNEKVLRNIPRAGYQIVQLSQRELRDALQLRLILETEAMDLNSGNDDRPLAGIYHLRGFLDRLTERFSISKWHVGLPSRPMPARDINHVSRELNIDRTTVTLKGI